MILDFYTNLVRLGDDPSEIRLRTVSDYFRIDYKDFIQDLCFEKDYTGICVCEFQDPDEPTLDEIDACPCVPSFVKKDGVEARIEGEEAYMTANQLSNAMIGLGSDLGDELRGLISDLVVSVIQDATGADVDEQMDLLDTALAHCTDDDETPLTTLLDGTLEQVRHHFDQKP